MKDSTKVTQSVNVRASAESQVSQAETNKALTSNKRNTLASAPTSSLSEKIRDMAPF